MSYTYKDMYYSIPWWMIYCFDYSFVCIIRDRITLKCFISCKCFNIILFGVNSFFYLSNAAKRMLPIKSVYVGLHYMLFTNVLVSSIVRPTAYH